MSGWAILGTGRVSRHMAEAVEAAPDADLVAVLSRGCESGERFAAAHGSPSVYQTLEDLLQDRAVDIVYVATPNALHRDQVVSAADAGKHVLCEKPMATDVSACLDMITACERNSVFLGIGFHYRQHPAHQLMAQIVGSGRLGQAVFADASVYAPGVDPPAWYRDQTLSAGSGVLSMAGVHRIDLLRFVLGAEVEEVSAFVSGEVYDDAVTAMLRFEEGVTATVRFGLGLKRGADPLSVCCTEGRVAGVNTTSQSWSDGRGHVTVVSGGSEPPTEFQVTDLYRDQVEDFARAVKGHSVAFATGLDGLRAVEIMSAIYESGRTGKKIPISRALP